MGAFYQNDPTAVAIVRVLAGRIQTLENVLQDVASKFLLYGNGASGAQLDGIGSLIGLTRGSLDDGTYRVLILGTIAENNSDGTAGTFLQVAKTIFEADDAWLGCPNALGSARHGASASVALAVINPQIDLSLLPQLLSILKNTLASAITLRAITRAGASAFACAGRSTWAKGCSNLAGVGGGRLGALLYSTGPKPDWTPLPAGTFSSAPLSTAQVKVTQKPVASQQVTHTEEYYDVLSNPYDFIEIGILQLIQQFNGQGVYDFRVPAEQATFNYKFPRAGVLFGVTITGTLSNGANIGVYVQKVDGTTGNGADVITPTQSGAFLSNLNLGYAYTAPSPITFNQGDLCRMKFFSDRTVNVDLAGFLNIGHTKIQPSS